MAKVDTTLYGEIAFLPLESQVPILERNEWLTDVRIAHSGDEDRYKNRSMPRQTFELSIPADEWKKMEAFNTFYGAIRSDWGVPLWNESQYIGTVTGGATSISCDTDNYDFRNDSLAVLYSRDGTYEIIEIETVSSGVLNLYGSGVTSNVNVYLMPVRVCIIDGDIRNLTHGFDNIFNVRFRVKDNVEITETVPEQYDDADIYYIVNYSKGYLTRTISKLQDVADFDIGTFRQRTSWDHTRLSFAYKDLLEDVEQIRAFRRFLQRRSGRYRAFWYPSFQNDFEILSTGTLTDTVRVRSNSIFDWASAKNHIAFNASGSWYPREITLITEIDSDTVDLTLDTNLNLDADDISSTSYLGYFRFAGDRAEFRWTGNGLVKVSCNFVEIRPNRIDPIVVE